MMLDKKKSELNNQIRNLCNLTCWAIVGGKGTGTIISLHFGKHVLRKTPLNNPTLVKDIRENEGEYCILIYCSWELSQDNNSIVDTTNLAIDEQDIFIELQKLIGLKIRNIDLNIETLDLTITFEKNKNLRILCDDYEEDNDNYMLSTPDKHFTINSNREIETDIREIL